MENKKIIAVLGATGSQGGGLVRAILANKDGDFTARAITRDVNSDKAQALAKLGADVVTADVDDPESLKRAFPGAEDLGNMFQFKRDFEQYFCGVREIDTARALNPKLQTFAAWLSQNKDRIPIE